MCKVKQFTKMYVMNYIMPQFWNCNLVDIIVILLKNVSLHNMFINLKIVYRTLMIAGNATSIMDTF